MDDWPELLARARAAIASGRPREGLLYCDRAASQGEEACYEAALLRGGILLELGDAAGALSCYETVADPGRPDSRIDGARGIALFEMGSLPEAQAALRSAIRGDGAQAEVHYTLGLIAEISGRESAAAHFREAYRLQPDRFSPEHQYGRDAFEQIIEAAVSNLAPATAAALVDYPIVVAELPEFDEQSKLSPPISPLSLAVVFGIGDHGPVRDSLGGAGLLLFKRNFERAFRTRSDLVDGIRQTVMREFAEALGLDADAE